MMEHCRGQQGERGAFAWPSQVWAGFASVPISATDYQWRDATTFSVGLSAPLRYNVSIELESVAV